MKTALITTTRNRSMCFSLLERWICAQTCPPDHWLVINDGEEKYAYTCGQEVIHRVPEPDEALPSICMNWLAALPKLKKWESIIVVEDDDWYHPTYLRKMKEGLESFDLVGLRQDLYFRFSQRAFKRMHNMEHASLSCTGFRRRVLPQIKRCCEMFKSVFIDMGLWAEAGQEISAVPKLTKALSPNLAEDKRAYHVGMKNMPGCRGLGLGHGQDCLGWSRDGAFQVLSSWIGAKDAKVYRDWWQAEYGKQPRSALPSQTR